MKKQSFNYSSIFSDIKFSILVGGGFSVLFFVSLSTFAALTKDTPGPDNEPPGGTFMYWLQEILFPESIPTENGIFQTNTEIINPTVKKSRRLANIDGSQVAIGKNGKLGIGTENPSELVEISGNTPRMLISSVAQNPQLKLIANSKNSGKIYFDQNKHELIFSKGRESSLRITEKGNALAKNEVRENGVIVVHGNQRCEKGLFVRGFDENGYILCGGNY